MPAVRWFGDDPQWFEVPYLMVEWMHGRTFFVWDPDVSFDRSPQAVAGIYEQAVLAPEALRELLAEGFSHFGPPIARADCRKGREAPRRKCGR